MAHKKELPMVTMKDVAETAGVSTATVSRALMNPDKVSTSTRQKVEKAILAVGYMPHALSRNIKRHESRTILVMIPDICDPCVADVLQGVENIALQHGYLVLIGNCSQYKQQEPTFTSLLIAKQIDGMLLLSTKLPFNVSKDERRNLPPMVMANDFAPDLELPTVHIDNLTAAFQAVHYLHKIGHRQIACVAGQEQMLVSHYRLQGYIQALRRNGISIENHYIIRSEFTYEAGAQALSSLMALQKPPTAIFCHSDVTAIGVLSQAKKMGLRVPHDLSIVGFGDIKLAQYCDPPLTTVALPRFQIGQQAMLLLLDQLQGREVSSGSRLLDSELIIRNSTAAPPVLETSGRRLQAIWG